MGLRTSKAVSSDHIKELNVQGLEARREFDRGGNNVKLDEAINIGRQAVGYTTLEHPLPTATLVNLVMSLLRKYEQTTSGAILDEALSKAEDALEATPSSHQHRSVVLGTLGICLRMKYEKTGDLVDLDRGVDVGRGSARTVHRDDPQRATILSNLSVLLRRKFERFGNLNDLNEAIRNELEAVALMPRENPYRSSTLANLSHNLMRRFERKGDVDDLNSAISRGDEAAKAMPDRHVDKGLALGNLGTCLRYRSQRTGDMAELKRAIDVGQHAVRVTGHNHMDLAVRLSNLAGSLFTRYERTSTLNDLNRAIDCERQAVAICRMPDRRQAKVESISLNNLGIYLKCRFERGHDAGDLNAAIRLEEESVSITPDDNPDKANRLIALCNSYLHKYELLTKDLSDLNKAVEYGSKATALTPADHPSRTPTLSTLAGCLLARFRETRDQSNLLNAIDKAEEAVDIVGAPPRQRIQAAILTAQMLALIRDGERLSNITEKAVELLPNVSPRALEQDDQQHMLSEFSGLASLAASAALEVGKPPSRAVELLELGRGIIMGLQFGTRSDLSDLKDEHRNKALKFERLRDELDASLPKVARLTGSDASTIQRNRHEVARELDKLIDEIRLLPNFKDFLKPLSEAELRHAGSSGPIVIVNVSQHRCHALFVKSDGIRAMALPNLRLADIQEKVKAPVSSAMLEWLWESTACPILDELGFRETLTCDWPRIWWIPTGLLSRLPLHAAGRHRRKSPEAVLDRVISSYSSSIKALVYARQNAVQKDLGTSAHRAVLVSMRKTPGVSDLLCAEQEIEVIDRIVPLTVHRESLVQPRKREILKALGTCTIFHFAGHGRSHPLDPSKSCLLLQNWRDDPLTVKDLAGLKLHTKSPWLSYLSACSTGESEAEQLQDETIHLVSACQLAGFPHVVGSLWEVDDESSVYMARDVYKTLIKEGWKSDAVALGVHNAARLLRWETCGIAWGPGYAVRSEGKPAIWAAYIHVGP